MGFVYLDQAVIEWKAVEVVHIPLEVGHLDNLVFGIELVERDFLQVESKFLKVALSLSLSGIIGTSTTTAWATSLTGVLGSRTCRILPSLTSYALRIPEPFSSVVVGCAGATPAIGVGSFAAASKVGVAAGAGTTPVIGVGPAGSAIIAGATVAAATTTLGFLGSPRSEILGRTASRMAWTVSFFCRRSWKTASSR